MPALLHDQLLRRALVASLLITGLMLQTDPAAAASLVVRSGARSQPVVALTFDDGDNPANAAAIFAYLQQAAVPATFFPFTNAMQAAPDLWKRVGAAGYPIGNHSVSHTNLTALSDAALWAEVQGATAVITELTGQPPINVLRPPYGEWNERVAQAADGGGYSRILLWDVDPADWSGIPAAAITQRVVTAAQNGSVILLHTRAPQTLVALPAIVAGLQARGFGFVTVPQLFGDPGRAGPQPELEHMTHPARPAMGQDPGDPILLLRRHEVPSHHPMLRFSSPVDRRLPVAS